MSMTTYALVLILFGGGGAPAMTTIPNFINMEDCEIAGAMFVAQAKRDKDRDPHFQCVAVPERGE